MVILDSREEELITMKLRQRYAVVENSCEGAMKKHLKGLLIHEEIAKDTQNSRLLATKHGPIFGRAKDGRFMAKFDKKQTDKNTMK